MATPPSTHDASPAATTTQPETNSPEPSDAPPSRATSIMRALQDDPAPGSEPEALPASIGDQRITDNLRGVGGGGIAAGPGWVSPAADQTLEKELDELSRQSKGHDLKRKRKPDSQESSHSPKIPRIVHPEAQRSRPSSPVGPASPDTSNPGAVNREDALIGNGTGKQQQCASSSDADEQVGTANGEEAEEDSKG